MTYNPKIHHRRSLRLKGYDYSQSGAYFITICCQNRTHLFGQVRDGEMVLNEAGQMIERWYYELEHKFCDIKIGEFVVMPNHFHGIIINNGNGNPHMKKIVTVAVSTLIPASAIGADLRVCPIISDEHIILGEHVGSPLSAAVQWFKTMTTNEYIRGVKTRGWQPFDKKIWQRNYYEIIIRNEWSYENISNYILNNPSKWEADTFHPKK